MSPLSVSIVTVRTSSVPRAAGCSVGQPGGYVGPGCVGAADASAELTGVAGGTVGSDAPPLLHAARSAGIASAAATIERR